MSSEQQIELHRQHRTSQDKYTYFLLAAAASAVALTVNRTEGMVLHWSMLPLGIAVICWGLSFYFGCRHLGYVSSNISANYKLLQVEAGEDPEIGHHPEMIEAASQGIRQAIESNSEHANFLGHWQFRMLIAGALFYLGWHIAEMGIRTF